MVLFIMLDKMILTSVSVKENLSVTIQMEATEQHFPTVLGVSSMVSKCFLTYIMWIKS